MGDSYAWAMAVKSCNPCVTSFEKMSFGLIPLSDGVPHELMTLGSWAFPFFFRSVHLVIKPLAVKLLCAKYSFWYPGCQSMLCDVQYVRGSRVWCALNPSQEGVMTMSSSAFFL